HIYFMSDSEEGFQQGLKLADTLRKNIPGLRILQHCGGGSFKSQFKKADKSGAKLALIVGDEEVFNQTVGIKWLRIQQQQRTVAQTDLVSIIQPLIEE
ncbi:MAG: histidine--tRNA ligase, partial [Legionellales bacterium]|nr:histidine--tRNA ligase [Legionellales bacterium]